MKTLWEQTELSCPHNGGIPLSRRLVGGSEVTLAAGLIFLVAAETSSQFTCPQLQVRMTKEGEAEARIVSEPERTAGDRKVSDATGTPWTGGGCDQAGSSYRLSPSQQSLIAQHIS